jgi:hypothetical protein
LFFAFVHPERQASDKVHKSEEPVSFFFVRVAKAMIAITAGVVAYSRPSRDMQ